MKKLLQMMVAVLFPLAAMGALTVNNGGGATNITATSAWITATIASTGAANPSLYSYWGTNDGSTSVASWKNTNSFGVSTQGAYSFQATSLSGSKIYYFRSFASNATESNWASYSAQFVTLTTPTTAPPSSVQNVTVDTNDVLKHPTNFFVVNSNSIKTAIGFSGDTDSNAVWGNITGTLANQLDLTDTVSKATSASQPGHEQDWASITNVPGHDEAPYQAWTNIIPVDGTATVVKANGSLVSLVLDAPVTITFDSTTYPTSGVSRVGMEIYAGTNSVAFLSDTITNATAPAISTSSWTSLFFRRTADGLWKGRQ